MSRRLLTILAVLMLTDALPAQTPKTIAYTLRVDPADLSGVTVDMRIQGAASAFEVAMVAHTEYDDQFWRYLEELRGDSPSGEVRITRADSARWQVNGPTGNITLHYRVRFPSSPPMQQASWMAHLVPNGGLIGGPHSFLYVVGAEHVPIRVTVLLPGAWSIVTGLDSAAGPNIYSAAGIEALVDSPMLVGLLRTWNFNVDGVPHRIAYLGRSAGVAFDSVQFVAGVERFARETVRMFGRMPYRKYQFLFEDGTYGGLEHMNSVSIGVQSSNLARDPNSMFGQIAHEFFHTWNEVHLRPTSWIGVRYAAPAPTGELWFSEGVTLYFADLLLRRAGLYTSDTTRVQHLERMIGSYLANPSHAKVSAEETSRAFNLPLSETGDYSPSMFTQGELLGAMLDLIIRDGSKGRRSLDDAMRSLSTQFTIQRGFTGTDVERAVANACECQMRSFFDSYVRTANALEFDKWLALIGLRTSVTWAPAQTNDGRPAPDLRVTANSYPGEPNPQLKIVFPATVWGRAGLHTGDRVELVNGVVMQNSQQFRTVISQLHIGDTVHIAAQRGAVKVERTIIVPGYDRPTVRIETRPDATAAQRRLYEQWLAGR